MQMDIDGSYKIRVVTGMGRANHHQEGDTVVMYKLKQEEIEAMKEARTRKILEPEKKKKRAEAPPPAIVQRRDWIAELMEKEPYINNIREFSAKITTDKTIHLVMDGEARPNPGSAGWGSIVRQNKMFTMVWKHFPRAMNSMMELRAVVEMLGYLPPNMTVLVSSDSQYVRLGITQWINKWKRNGWRNARKGGVANATLWRELDMAITHHRHVEFTLVKVHSGILLNECTDQLDTMGVAGDLYDEKIPVIPVPDEEPESSEEHEISEEKATQFEDLEATEQRPPNRYIAKSVGLSADEEHEGQEEMLRRFKPWPVSGILKRTMEQPPPPEIVLVPSDSGSASPKVSSKDSNINAQLPDPDESRVFILGNGVEVV
jgi:ribonuclease HI